MTVCDNSTIYFHKNGRDIVAWADKAGQVHTGRPDPSRCAAYRRHLAAVRCEYLHTDEDIPEAERTVRVGLLHGVVVGAIFCAAMAAGYRCGFDRGATYSDDGTVRYFSAEQSERFDALRRAGWSPAQALAEVSP